MNDFSEQEKESFYKAIYSRRDVRSNFTSEPIDDQVLTRILDAAHHAPSVGFSQPWNFILIKNIETRKKSRNPLKKKKPGVPSWLRSQGGQNICLTSLREF